MGSEEERAHELDAASILHGPHYSSVPMSQLCPRITALSLRHSSVPRHKRLEGRPPLETLHVEGQVAVPAVSETWTEHWKNWLDPSAQLNFPLVRTHLEFKKKYMKSFHLSSF